MLVRSVTAVLVGALVASVVFWLGAVIAMVAVYGLPPLGAPSTGASAGYFALNLGFATLAGVTGGWLAATIARRRPIAHAVVLAVLLAAFVLWGFGKPASTWPAWYAPLLALVGAGTALAGGLLRRRR